MPTNESLSQIYESYSMLHPDGTFMCYCNKRKADWYIKRNLAKWTDEKTFKLIFEPNGHGKSNNPYYTQVMENKCVVCGTSSHLNKHHVLPYVFRSRLPLEYKESNHHDVVVICIECHEQYETLATKYKAEIAAKYGIEMHGEVSTEQLINKKINSAIKVLEKYKTGEIVGIPDDRLLFLKNIANQKLLNYKIETGPVWADSIMKIILDTNGLFDFVKQWRNHFVENMKPQFLPKYWSIDTPLEKTGNTSNHT
jgi:hypothetical protein